ncbi:MAG: TolC family protein [Candidatus Omnitrophica bacterium]|nr:TolC family protein [Candidatus Omnitrophota bacterium]MBU1631072.1 TolC family protein [Candidatus Omnitrophota bacterium]MBU1889340.1 TolC family protein [Candidatus Omnitrophota bacterium]
MKQMKWINSLGIFLAIFFLTGCGAARIRTSADREVYKILEKKTKEVTSEKIPWDIRFQSIQETPSEDTPLTLKDVLIIATKNNRDYQSAKEDVYLQTLALISQRYNYSLRYGIDGTVTWEKDSLGTENVNADLNLNLVKWLAQGAQITFNIAQEYLKYLIGDTDGIFQTVVGLDILQPLFRGAGRSVAQAGLIQAERDVIYQIRSFLRYQRGFSVTVADKYFTLLEVENNLENYSKNYIYLKQTRGRIEMLSEAGRATPIEVDQTRQDEYRAYQSWLSANNNYQKLLDEFKIFLGLSPEIKISLEAEGLETFLEEGISEIKVEPQESVKLALEKRLDLMTAYDQLEDSKRDVHVALNALRTRLDLNLGVESRTPTGDKPSWEFEEPTYTAGFNLELPLNKVPERNAYIQALISFEREKRSVTQTRDELKLDILNLCRDLEELYQTYIIQDKSLKLASKRVEGTDLLLQAGRATTRDLLEAQESYLNAKNSLSTAIVNYLVSYLEFLRDTETLEIDEGGVWKGDLYEKISGERD